MSESTVGVTVELFGTARAACGRREVAVNMPSSTLLADVAGILAAACPELIGKVINEDLSGLMESFTLNLNGTAFLSSSSEEVMQLHDGDRLLLFSSQAGG